MENILIEIYEAHPFMFGFAFFLCMVSPKDAIRVLAIWVMLTVLLP